MTRLIRDVTDFQIPIRRNPTLFRKSKIRWILKIQSCRIRKFLQHDVFVLEEHSAHMFKVMRSNRLEI